MESTVTGPRTLRHTAATRMLQRGASIKAFRWQSIAWGLLLVAVYYAMLLPLGEWVRRSAGLPGFGTGMEQVTRFPLWYRAVAVVGAGIGEEMLFRGFSVTRIAVLTGRIWLAALVTLVGFYVLHVPQYGDGVLRWEALSAALP
jgi:membrane protease YdiL (CAAX protease family)